MYTLLAARLNDVVVDVAVSMVGAIILIVIVVWLSGLIGSKPRRYCAKHERMCGCCCKFHPKDRLFYTANVVLGEFILQASLFEAF